MTDQARRPGGQKSSDLSCTQDLRTHILAASDYSLVKEQDGFPSKRQGQLSLSSSWVPRIGEAESYRRFRFCQRGVENFPSHPQNTAELAAHACLDKTYRQRAQQIFDPALCCASLTVREPRRQVRFRPNQKSMLRKKQQAARSLSLPPFTHSGRPLADGR